MRKFLLDAIDLALLRVRPLDTYVYDWRVPIGWLTFVSAVMSLLAVDLKAGIVERTLLIVCSLWVDMLLETLFLGWWIRLDKRCTQRGSLFPLLVLLGSIRLLLPIGMMLPGALALLVMMFVGIYGLVVMVRALSKSTGAGLGHTIAGLLAFAPISLLLGLGLMKLEVGLGWIDLKQLQQEQSALVAQPATDENTTQPTQSGTGEK